MSQSYHCTPEQRVQLVSQLLAGAGSYGVVSRLQRQSAVSRHTLYTWRARAHQALLASFSAPPLSAPPSVDRVRAILTLLVDTHASYRGIQHAMRTLGCGSVSLGTISAVVRDAERRAQHWLATHAPTTMRNIALDELYGSRQRTACLSIVDTQSWAVWAVGGPVNVDGESWTLLLWQAQASGLRWSTTISDGERAIQQACQAVDPQGTHGRDVWHVLHECAQIQGHLDRQVGQLEAQAVTVGRQVARLAAGRKPMGRTPTRIWWPTRCGSRTPGRWHRASTIWGASCANCSPSSCAAGDRCWATRSASRNSGWCSAYSRSSRPRHRARSRPTWRSTTTISPWPWRTYSISVGLWSRSRSALGRH